MDCIFCAIAKGEIPSKVAYEDENVFAFYDIAPQAPVHILVIPKMHISSVDALDDSTSDIIARVMLAIPKVAKAAGLTNGYRVISNVGEDGCQSVKHLHFHILGGKKLPETMA
jgi:histidine triad (HIT) family protein